MKKQKRRFCVIGLGNFGYNVAVTLYNDGHEVTVIDPNKHIVEKITEQCSVPIVGTGNDREFLLANGINEMDAVIVATGDLSDTTTLITLLLKEIGVSRILARAKSEEHSRILEKVGATDVIFPEKDTAINVAKSLSNIHILDFLQLTEDYCVSVVTPPDSFIGTSFESLDLYNKFSLNLIAIRNTVNKELNIKPQKEGLVSKDDIFVVLGKNEDIEKLLSHE